MNFLRCDGGQKASPSAVFFRLALIAAIAGECFGQASHSRRVSHEPSAKEISRYLVSRDIDEANVTAQASPTLSLDAIVERIMNANARRSAELLGFEGKRWYHLEYHGLFGGKNASMEVLATYSAPDQHNFSVTSQSGSKLLLNRVLLKLLDSEKEAFQNHKQVELSPQNYNFTLVGMEKVPPGDTCYVLKVKPRKENKFLYAGKIWVDAHDFAVVRMEGEPAKAPSFWVRDTQISSNWEKVGNFWFIAHNHSVSHIRMGGVATLNIDYGEYQITRVDRDAARTQAQGPALPDPASVTPQR
jgi:hypothetical protein